MLQLAACLVGVLHGAARREFEPNSLLPLRQGIDDFDAHAYPGP